MSYLGTQTPTGEGELRQAAASLLGSGVAGLSRVSGGGNNRLYRVDGEDGRRYALKAYYRNESDERDRLGAEFDGLRFLWQQGIRGVPRALAKDRAAGYAAYEWIEGEGIATPGNIEIDQAAAFLTELHALAGSAKAAELPLAAEACLCGSELVRQIEHRASRLRAVDHMGLRRFLAEPFAELHDRSIDAATDGYAAIGLDFETPVALAQQTLSPSDFGFHNARRRPDGTIVFLDFEYFGRDDPVKLTADFMLHPAMSLSRHLKRRFFQHAASIYGSEPGFALRFRLLYPLYGLRWAMILLNEFLPERWEQRTFAKQEEEQQERVQERQLAKARRTLDHIHRISTEFPYDA